MRRTVIWMILLVVGLAFGPMALEGCETRTQRKYRKWKKRKKRKKWKRWKKRHRHHPRYHRPRHRARYKSPRQTPTTLRAFLGDSTDVNLAAVPLRLGQGRSSADAFIGVEGVRKFKAPLGKISVKVEVGPDDKVRLIKAFFKMDFQTVLAAAKTKWGDPEKSKPSKVKWRKGKLKIILEDRSTEGKSKVKITIKEGIKGTRGGSSRGGSEDTQARQR